MTAPPVPDAAYVVICPSDALAGAVRTAYPDAVAARRVRFEHVPLADAVVRRASDDAVLCYIERKTVADLVASRKDGRWQSQGADMARRAAASGARVVYAIEARRDAVYGGSAAKICGMSANTVRNMLCNAELIDGDTVVFTGPTPADTACYVVDQALRNHAVLAGAKSVRAPRAQSATSALDIVAHRRQAEIAPDNFHLHVLFTVPGIGRDRARAVAAAYPGGLPALIEAAEASVHAFTHIAGIGKALSVKICAHLTGSDRAPASRRAAKKRPPPPPVRTVPPPTDAPFRAVSKSEASSSVGFQRWASMGFGVDGQSG